MTLNNYTRVTASDIGFAEDADLLDLPRSGSAILIRDYRRIPSGDISPVLAMYAELFARARCFEKGHQNLLSFLRGIVGLHRRIRVAMKKDAMAAKRSHGRSLTGQYVDMCRAWWVTGLEPNDYYHGQLARHSGTSFIKGYLPPGLLANVIVELQFNQFGPLPIALNDKAKMAMWCQENDVQCLSGLALDPGAPAPDVDAIMSLGDSLFVKSRSDMGGAQAEVWQQTPGGRWQGKERNLSTQELSNWFEERAANETVRSQGI